MEGLTRIIIIRNGAECRGYMTAQGSIVYVTGPLLKRNPRYSKARVGAFTAKPGPANGSTPHDARYADAAHKARGWANKPERSIKRKTAPPPMHGWSCK